MSDAQKPFVHAAILAAWGADPKGVTIEAHNRREGRWTLWHAFAERAPALDPEERYRATLRNGDVIESPEPKWEAGQFTPESPWIVRRGEGGASSGALVYPDAPDAQATAHMIAAYWNGEGDRPHIPDGYEYMPSAVLPKPLTFEEARKRDTVYRPGLTGINPIDGSHVAEGVTYYATYEQAQQVFDAQWRREEQ